MYQFNPRPIDDAFEIMGAKKAFETAELIRKGKLFKQCFLLLERSINKLRCLCAKYQDENNYRCVIQRQRICLMTIRVREVSFMDDVRGGGCNAEDWLKLLDNCNVSPASAI